MEQVMQINSDTLEGFTVEAISPLPIENGEELDRRLLGQNLGTGNSVTG